MKTLTPRQEEEARLARELPEATRDTLRGYVEHRLRPGSFIRGVLSNDLMTALAYADPDNRAALHKIVNYIRCCVPREAWGSEAKVDAWLGGR